MIRRLLVVDPGGDIAADWRRYRIAGIELACNRPIPRLRPWQRSALPGPSVAVPPPRPVTGAADVAHRGIVVDRLRDVACAYDGDRSRVDIGGIGSYQLDPGHMTLHLPAADQAPPATILDAMLGAPLALMLAARGGFLLHASAVALNGRALLFVGDSGAGKSTLARWLDGVDGIRRIGDDIVAAADAGDGPVALPHFPQFKLDPGGQYHRDRPQALPLAAVLLLRRGAATAAVAPLRGHRATLALVAHTDSSRLFGPTLLANHLRSCSRIAMATRIAELHYPEGHAALEAVAALLRGWSNPGPVA